MSMTVVRVCLVALTATACGLWVRGQPSPLCRWRECRCSIALSRAYALDKFGV